MLPEEYNELKEQPLIETPKEQKKPNFWRLVTLGGFTLCLLFFAVISFLFINVGKYQKCDECLTPYKQDNNFCRNGENLYKNDCKIVFPNMVYGVFFFVHSAACCFVAFLEFANEFSLYL
jgi:uncharacterized membrane protein YbhN (UPF0104 family)